MGPLPRTGITDMQVWREAHRPAGGIAVAANTAGTDYTGCVLTNVSFTATAPAEYGEDVRAEVVLRADGPSVLWYGEDPAKLMVLAQAMVDAARAARNGDDINAVALQEWERRGGQPELD